MQLLLGVILAHFLTAVSGQAANIVSALQLVQQQVQYTNQMVYYFTGNPKTGLLDAVNIQQQALVLGRAISYATQVVHASVPLDEAGSLAVTTVVIALRPDVESLLQTAAARKPAFDQVEVGLSSVTRKFQEVLINQKALTAALGYAVVEKLTGAYKDSAPLLLAEFKDAFDQAIAAYGT